MYTTQMDAARQHIITEEMKAVAAYEQMEEAEVCRLVAAGQVVIPANRHHTCRKFLWNRKHAEDKKSM